MPRSAGSMRTVIRNRSAWRRMRIRSPPATPGGFLNSFMGGGLATVPIVTQRTNADARGDIHDQLEDQIVRARLIKANGRADNQIIWRSGSTSGVDLADLSLDLLRT